MNKITVHDFVDMTGTEKEAFVYTTIGITKRELAEQIAEFEFDEGKKPNALFLSADVLCKIPTRIKKILGLVIIPMDATPDKFILSQVDPWDQRWEHLFYS